jgi:hypothetical protein
MLFILGLRLLMLCTSLMAAHARLRADYEERTEEGVYIMRHFLR